MHRKTGDSYLFNTVKMWIHGQNRSWLMIVGGLFTFNPSWSEAHTLGLKITYVSNTVVFETLDIWRGIVETYGNNNSQSNISLNYALF